MAPAENAGNREREAGEERGASGAGSPARFAFAGRGGASAPLRRDRGPPVRARWRFGHLSRNSPASPQ